MRNFKKILFLVLCLALMLTFIACGDDVTVKFDTQGGTQINDIVIEKGDNVPKPSDPEKAGYAFDGWYADGEEWSFVGYTVANDITLTAKWTPVEYTITFAGNVENAPVKYTIEDAITLPDGIAKLDYYSFDGWFEDEELTKPISKFEKGAYGDKILYAKTTYTGIELILKNDKYSVTNCDPNATEIVIPSTYNGKSVTSIDSCAFEGCSALTSVTIPDSVTEIGYHAFEGCSNLTSVTIPNSVTEIGDGAFFLCSKLTSITIPDGVTEIGESAFSYCSKLTSVTIPNSVTEIGYSAFAGCSALTSITIPDSVTEIGENAFRDCSSLTSVTIGNGVTSIGGGAFRDCSSLESVTIPDGVTSIGVCAFSGCSSLTSVTIGNSVTSMGDYAFEGCSSLTIYCEATSQPSGWDDEWNYSNCPVYWYSESEPTESGNYWHYGTNGEIVVWE